MKKGDKLIAVLGVFILIVAAVGIYYWVEEEPIEKKADVEDFFEVSSEFEMIPDAITVSDSCPYYAVIATPLAVNFDEEGTKNVIPLFIENADEVSTAVTKAKEQIGYKPEDEMSKLSAKEFSIHIAEKYWKNSNAALLIEFNDTGYDLGIVAAPIASYLGIPIFVTDEIDIDIKECLEDLGVTNTIICGDLEGYQNTLRFETCEEIINATIDIIRERLGHDVEYIAMANPLDARPPEVLDSEIVLSEKGTIKSSAHYPSNFLKAMTYTPPHFKFTIPDDYKYALVKLYFRNLEDPRHIEMFGDDVIIEGSLTRYMRTTAYPSVTDTNGDLEEDVFYFETVLYDSGGEEFNIGLSAIFHVLDSAEYELTVTVEEIDNPYYAMMPQFSSIAPYLAACREGIVYAKPEFAFVADDGVKYKGKQLTGNTQPYYNPALIPLINQHMYENIHIPLNELIAQIKDFDITDSVEFLKKDCTDNPIYIALLGDTVMLPQYYFRSPHSDPFTNPKSGIYGTNTPSDYIYSNIDPEIYSLQPYDPDHLENDLYSDFPEAENIVGRIVGYDIQDASALIARTIFYDNIIETLGDWKDNAAVLVGAGAEVQRLPILNTIQKILGQTDPMKFPTGEKRFLVMRIKENFEYAGFTAESAERGAAMRTGFTTEALWKLKTDGLLNLLFFPMAKLKLRQGFEDVTSLKDPQWWITTLFGDSSELAIGQDLEENSNYLLCDGHAIHFEKGFGDIMLHSLGGPFYELFIRYIPIGLIPRTYLDRLGGFSCREVPYLDMGPSIYMAEGCGSGKIDGMIPENNLGSAYLHAGINTYISPTTFSAFYGALEPRPNFNGGVGFGILGYIKTLLDWKLKGEYPEVCFNQFIFEEMIHEMADDDVPIGLALRDSKNIFLPETFDQSFRWRPVLDLPTSLPSSVREEVMDSYGATAGSGMQNFPVEKYATIYQLNLLGDPAFNPYEPKNNG